MKYVVFKDRRTERFHAVIFSDFVTHADVYVKSMRPVSAGFVDPKTGETYGESESLKLQPSQDDSILLVATLANSNAHLAMF